MTWLYYLLEANLYLAIFYGFYRLLLHRETFYQWNRYYLLGTSVLAFLLPIFQISYLNSLLHPIPEQATVTVQYSGELFITVQKTPVLTAENILLVAYLLVAGCLLFRLGTSLYGIFRMAARAEKTRKDGIIQVHSSQSDTAFSFFNLLFIHPGTEQKNIILQHEMIHIRQKHSLDILFFEMLLICNWFNPVCWLIKRDIKLVHEYIADEATTSQGLVKHDYALFLIQNSFGSLPNPLTSQMFNQSILKNRINMLNKKRSAARARLRLLYVLPLTGGMLCASTLGFAKDYAFVDLYARKQQTLALPVQETSPQEKQYFFVKDSDKRLLVLNGKKLDRKGIITIEGFDKMTELNGKTAAEKYGSAGANGAVEFAGKNTMATNKFPPPVVKLDPPKKEAQQQNKKVYSIESRYDAETGDSHPVKLIVINGKISRAKNYTSVSRFDEVKELNSSEAVAKYGNRASKGALEFTGKNAGVDIKFPPPIPEKPTAPLAPPAPDQKGKVKFPPPAPVKPKSGKVKFPPPAAPVEIRLTPPPPPERADKPKSISVKSETLEPAPVDQPNEITITAPQTKADQEIKEAVSSEIKKARLKSKSKPGKVKDAGVISIQVKND